MTSTTSKNSSTPITRACLECRRKHVKCDGRAPICSLCERVNATCQYVESRRGTKGPGRRPGNPNRSGTSPTNDPLAWPAALPPSLPVDISRPSVIYSDSASIDAPPNNTTTPPSLTYSDTRSPESEGRRSPSRCNFDAYYKFFHNAHPMLQPYTQAGLCERSPPGLRRVVEYIGSLYSAKLSVGAVEMTSTTELLVGVQAMPNSGHKVQALLLICIVSYGQNDQMKAYDLMQQCIDLALQLKMNEQAFAVTQGGGDKLLEESWRRTWWEIYCVDGMISAFLQKPFCRTGTVHSDIPIPIEESSYAAGMVPSELLSTDQFRNRAFEDDHLDFSSYAYRIEAIRLLGKVVAIDHSIDREQNLEDAETLLANWFLLLPTQKMSVVDEEGEVDEVLFQAHMIVNSCNIMVHLPRSNLASAAVDKAQITCAGSTAAQCETSDAHTHAVKALTAAKNLSNLISITMENTKHTPFFICAIVLSVVMQLSACCIQACKCLDPHQAKISMSLGALKAMGSVWPLAVSVTQQVRKTAKEVLAIGVKRSYQQVNEDNGFVFNFDYIVNDSMWSSVPISSSELFTSASNDLY